MKFYLSLVLALAMATGAGAAEIGYNYRTVPQEGLQDLDIHGGLVAQVGVLNDIVGVVISRKAKMAPVAFNCTGPGDFTQMTRINNRGDTAGSSENAARNKEIGCIRSRDGAITVVDVPGSNGTMIKAISDQRQTCGMFFNPGSPTDTSAFTRMHAFCHSAQGKFQTALDIPVDHSVTEITGISRSGKRVGNYFTYDPMTNENGPWHCFMLDNGIYTSLERPGRTWSYCSDLNNNDVVLYEDDEDVFLLDDGIYFRISPPPPDPGYTLRQLDPTGINDDLQFVGMYRLVQTGCTASVCPQIRRNFVATPSQ